MNTQSYQVHRFHDKLAIYIGTGETVYISVKQARELTRAMNKINRSIERESFVNSPDGLTFSMRIEN